MSAKAYIDEHLAAITEAGHNFCVPRPELKLKGVYPMEEVDPYFPYEDWIAVDFDYQRDAGVVRLDATLRVMAYKSAIWWTLKMELPFPFEMPPIKFLELSEPC